MSISSSHQDLFRQPSAAEKISLVRSLMDTGDLNADVATALLKSIHSELAQPQSQNHSLYASYARLMQSLQHEMPEVHQQVVATWQAARQAETEDISWAEEPPETETGGKVEPKSTEESRAEETAEPGGSSEAEGAPEESEAEEEEEKEEKEEQEAEKGEVEDEEEIEKEEHEAEEPEQVEEPEDENQEEENEVEVNVEESEIEQEELEAKEEFGEEGAHEEKEEPEELEVAGEEVKESEKPEAGDETSKAEDSDPVEESDHIATEAAEAAVHMEHEAGETEVSEEEPGEEEPPIEAVE
jgi:hypothetical protein